MGTDIHGWVEVYSPDIEMWSAVVDLGSIIGDRNYELFSWLFGVRRRPDIRMRWEFEPVAGGRGLPADASSGARAGYEADIAACPNEYYGCTWITWNEILSIDWDEPIEDRVMESRRDDPRDWGARSWKSQFLKQPPASWSGAAEGLQPGKEWEAGDRVYRVFATRRKDVLDEWELIFRLTEVLASKYGGDGVRLVVWFDG